MIHIGDPNSSMSSSILSTRPNTIRKSSHIPGEYEPPDDEGSVAGNMDHIHNDSLQDISSPLPGPQDPSSLLQPHGDDSGAHLPNNTVLEEQEMRNRLMDVESSFLPELSHLASTSQKEGANNSFVFGSPNANLAVKKRPHPIEVSSHFRDISAESSKEIADARSPRTPPETYKTPAPEQQNFPNMEDEENATPEIPNTSALEKMSSSPTAARTLSRVQSLATLGGYETAAEERDFPNSPSKKPHHTQDDEDSTPRKAFQPNGVLDIPTTSGFSASTSGLTYPQPAKRPRYLNSRSSNNRLSYDSMASSNTDASDATLGADFALQSGGAVSEPKAQRRGKPTLSRQASLGSILSGISGTSDDEGRGPPNGNLPNLSTLEEESPRSNTESKRTFTGPITPRASSNNLIMPSDTVIANNVRDIEVPGTFARQYRQERNKSPSRTLTDATPGPKRGLTLKEHRSTVEKLGKENFDLKMKIHFLDQALARRSEDGVKEMITENVQLKSDRMRLKKRTMVSVNRTESYRRSSKRMVNVILQMQIKAMLPMKNEVRLPRKRYCTCENVLKLQRSRWRSFDQKIWLKRPRNENWLRWFDLLATVELAHLTLDPAKSETCGKICWRLRRSQGSNPRKRTSVCGMRLARFDRRPSVLVAIRARIDSELQSFLA